MAGEHRAHTSAPDSTSSAGAQVAQAAYDALASQLTKFGLREGFRYLRPDQNAFTSVGVVHLGRVEPSVAARLAEILERVALQPTSEIIPDAMTGPGTVPPSGRTDDNSKGESR
jgi:hypothetical protein